MERQTLVYERWVKPVLDRVVAALLLVLTAPILVAIAITIRTLLGPGVIYRQRRVGLHGRHFTMYKFRTMHPDRRGRDERVSERDDRRRTHKTDADPRHTSIGRMLRRYSLDELPQFWNVLKGDLSLVGPRPELVYVVERHYQPWQHERHRVKPGLTGLWQVTQRDDMGQMHLHVDIDLRYIDNLTARTDLAIAIMTVPSLLNVSVPDWFGLRRLGVEDVATQPQDRPVHDSSDARRTALAPAYLAGPQDDSAISA